MGINVLEELASSTLKTEVAGSFITEHKHRIIWRKGIKVFLFQQTH